MSEQPDEKLMPLGKTLARFTRRFDTTTPTFKRFREALSKVDWTETEEQMKRIRAAKELPEGDPKREIWLRFLDVTPRFLAPIWRYLPDPLARRGRPKGRGKVGPVTLQEMDRRVAGGARPTVAARAIVGNVAGAKNAADHIVKVWKAKRGKKSR